MKVCHWWLYRPYHYLPQKCWIKEKFTIMHEVLPGGGARGELWAQQVCGLGGMNMVSSFKIISLELIKCRVHILDRKQVNASVQEARTLIHQ